MGMLSASVLTGLGQGGQVLAGGMLREVERQADQSIWEKRATLLEDIRRRSAQNQRIDERDFSVSPETLVAKDTVDKAANATARGIKLAELTDEPLNKAAREKMKGDAAAKSEADLASKKAEVGDTELTTAVVARENEILKGTMGAKAKAAGMLARATDMGGEVRAKQAELLGMDIADKKRLGKLYDDYLAIANNDGMTDEQRAQALRPISNAIGAIKAKNGAGAGKDPDAGTQTVEENEYNANGQEIRKTTRKVPYREGQGGTGPAADPLKAAMDAAREAAAKKTPTPAAAGGMVPRTAAAATKPFEQTQTPDGKTVFRMRGTQQWYSSKSDAIAALGSRRPVADDSGFEQGI